VAEILHAFRARILRMDAEKDKQIEFLNKVVDYSDKTSREKDARIAELEGYIDKHNERILK